MTRLSRGIRALDFIPTDPAGGILQFSDFTGKAATGEVITPEAALNISAYWRGVNLLSNSVATLPLKTYQRISDTERREAVEHPSYALLHHAPNPMMTSFTYRQTAMGHIVGWGNHYSEIERDGFSRPVALWPLRPDMMTLERERLSADALAAGLRPRKRYKYILPDGTVHYFGASDILHIKGQGFDGWVGYPVLTLMRNTVGIVSAMDQYAGATFKNGARPSVILTHPTRLSEKARTELAQDWTEKYGGLNNAQRVAVLEEGIKVETIGFPPEDAQWLLTRQFQVLEFARWLGLPPHKLYDLERATFSNIEQQALEYLTDSVNPWLVDWEQQMLLDLFIDDGFYPEFDRNGLLQVDARSRAFYYQTLRWLGVLNADTIAAKENLPIPPEGVGADYYVPMNMQRLGGPTIERGSAAPVPPEGEQFGETERELRLLDIEDRLLALESRPAEERVVVKERSNGSHAQ